MEYIVKILTKTVEQLKKTPIGEPFPVSGWNFFKDDLDDEWVICHLYNHSINNLLLINSFLLPKQLSPKSCNEELLEADYSSPQGWGIYGDGTLAHPLSSRTPPLDKGKPLYFYRHFQGFSLGGSNYFEISQELTTSLDLHWIPDRKAFCTLNSQGDLVSQIIVDNTDSLNYILIRRNLLDKYLSISNINLFRCYEYRQIDDDINYDKAKPNKESILSDNSFCYRNCYFNVERDTKGITIRGYNIVTQKKDYQQITQEEYAMEKGVCPLEFIIKDIRDRGKTRKIILAQENLTSYHANTSGMPWETSPVFFKGEVLHKYKNDPHKYEVTERTISCRGGWHLPTYDINEAGQVHTMAIYLTYLPFEELCYWRSFNEDPKGGISQRSFDTDFLAKFTTTIAPKDDLKNALDKLWKIPIQPENKPLWNPHNNDIDKTFFGFFYVVSDNYMEWQNYIQDLSRIITEGLSSQVLRKISTRLECYQENLGSIRLLEKCLLTVKIEQDVLENIITPLVNLQSARTRETKAHRGKDVQLGNLKEDAMDKLTKLINSMKLLTDVCEQGKLNG